MKKNKWWPLTDMEYHALVKRVNDGDGEDAFDDPCVKPKDEIDAVKLTIAKWHPGRGADRGASKACYASESCGCCLYYEHCETCILSTDKVGTANCCSVAFKYACKRLAELTE